MKSNKCFFCNKMTDNSLHLTEVKEDGKVEFFYMCEKCGGQYMSDLDGSELSKDPKIIDLTHIKTPQELLEFLTNIRVEQPKQQSCECGMTEDEFDKYGRFGCSQCYEHFHNKMEELVFPFHGAKQHVGKRPKRQIQEILENDPIEKEKVLKLQFAKAIEMENYERAGEIKKQLNLLKAEQVLTNSSDQ